MTMMKLQFSACWERKYLIVQGQDLRVVQGLLNIARFRREWDFGGLEYLSGDAELLIYSGELHCTAVEGLLFHSWGAQYMSLSLKNKGSC